MGNSTQRPSTIIDDQISNHCVVVFSTTVCGYCTKAKQLLEDMQMEYSSIELNLLSQNEGGRVVEDLIKRTRIRTVPQIFINGEFIGGYSEVLALKQTGLLFEKVLKCSKPCLKTQNRDPTS